MDFQPDYMLKRDLAMLSDPPQKKLQYIKHFYITLLTAVEAITLHQVSGFFPTS